LFVKLIHVLFAIVAVGFTTSFGIIMASAPAKPGGVPLGLHFISRLEGISGGCFLGLLITGAIMGFIGNVGFTTLWFTTSLLMQLVAMTLALTIARPTLHKQVELCAQTPPPMDELQRLGMKSKKIGMVLSTMSLAIVTLMVFKPTL
jgi:hypothetical protein